MVLQFIYKKNSHLVIKKLPPIKTYLRASGANGVENVLGKDVEKENGVEKSFGAHGAQVWCGGD